MQTDPVAAPDSDPLKAVADAMDAAVQAVKEGAESAKLTAADAWPAASRFLSRAVYQTSLRHLLRTGLPRGLDLADDPS